MTNNFLKSHDGFRRIGRKGQSVFAAKFTSSANQSKTYDVKAMANLLCNPPANFSDDDRSLVNDALEQTAMKNFGLELA